MKYILDTDTLSYLIQQDPDVIDKFTQLSQVQPAENIFLTIITHAEMRYGFEWARHKKKKVKDPENFLGAFPVLHFTSDTLPFYARLKADLRVKGALIGELDMLIASIALEHGAVFITSNLRDFMRIKGLKLESWKQ